MGKFILKYKCQLGLAVAALLIFITNYAPGTYLSGWDNLQTEFYPFLAVKRAFFSVWQEYQSFGLMSGMAHGADLIRAVFLWIISYVLPQSLTRYISHTLMLALGGIGMFVLLRKLFNKESDKYAFLGALFYMFNLGTVQIFFLPFEAFSIFFGFLPFLVWVFLEMLNNKRKSFRCFGLRISLIAVFIVLNLLATPSYYVQTLFAVYMLVLGAIVFGALFQSKKKKNVLNTLKRAVLALFIIFLINSFWILPQSYFVLNSRGVVESSKVNIMATENMFNLNKEKGVVGSFIKIEGFYFDLRGMNRNYLFSSWKDHFSKPAFASLQYLAILIIALGFLYKNKYRMSFSLLFIVLLAVFLSNTPPFREINQLLRNNSFINQIFRSPFTKFIIPLSLTLSFFFTAGLIVLSRLASRLKIIKLKSKYALLLAVLAIFLYSLPSFRGNFFSPEMKVKIPSDYIELFDYFKQVDKNKRIALLPDYTFWGWFFHKWGYNGSGFLWYGIEQPIVSRTFDTWSSQSEGYFWEMKSATEAEDIERFDKIIEKYDIDYFVIDYSLIPVAATTKGMQYDRINMLLKKSPRLRMIKKWDNLALYKTNQFDKRENFLSTVSGHVPNIGPSVKFTNEDTAYGVFGNYITDSKKPYDAYFPFMDLFSQTRLNTKKWSIDEGKDRFALSANLEQDFENYVFVAQDSPKSQKLYINGSVFEYSSDIDLSETQNTIYTRFRKIKVADINPSDTAVNNCYITPIGINTVSKNKGSITISSKGGDTACFGYEFEYLEQKNGYLVRLKHNNIEGRPLFFYILDRTKKQAYIEDRLGKSPQYYFLPPKYKYGVGYNLQFQNNSYRGIASTNTLHALEVYFFPYKSLKNMHFEKQGYSRPADTTYEKPKGSKLNYFLYVLTIDKSTDKPINTVILSQSYHKGWTAYSLTRCTNKGIKCKLKAYLPFVFGKSLGDHVKINNWANGWSIPPSTKTSCNTGDCQIIFVFLPQYLQFTGFGLLIIAFIIVLKYKHDKKRNNSIAVKTS